MFLVYRVNIAPWACPDTEESTVLTKVLTTTWMKTCSLRMPWIPFGKFILPLCQVSLIYVKAVRQHHWFRRLTLIRFIEQESSCFSQITEAHRAVLWSSHFWDATRRNVSFSESFRKSPWIGETAESWMDEHYPIFMGWLPSDKFWQFGQCTNVTWKRMCTQLLKLQWRAWGDAHLEKEHGTR